jgi:Ca-activated chloride channel family protein
MSLEAPAALLLGLAIPAVLLLWLLRPRRPRLRVPSLLLWPGSPAERKAARPWQRLRNHPLLWLQLIAAALLALAAARPFLPADAAGRHLIVLLDASGSMRAQDVAPDRFGLARAAVLDLARGLGPDQELTLIRLDEQPRVLATSARGVSEVERALAGEEASYGPADVNAALALAAGLARGPAEWVLVSDGGLALTQDVRRPPGIGFRFVPIGQQAGNVALTGLVVRQGSETLALQAGLRNAGPNAVSGTVQLLAEGQLAGSREWRLEAGQETFVSWSHLAIGPRWFEARVAGVPPVANALEQDDRAWAAVAGSDAEARVLLVSPGSTFLERALEVNGQVRAFRSAPADWAGLNAQGAAYSLTILDRFRPETLPGGSVLFVGPPAGEEFRPQQVWPRADHPLLRHVDWSEVRVAAAHRVPLDGAWETVIDSDGGPLLAVRSDGGRRQAVLAFDLGQSDLPLRPAFPVLLANLLDWLVPRPETAPRAVPPGAAVMVDAAPLAQGVWAERVDAEMGEHGDAEREAVSPGPRVSASPRLADLAPPWPPRAFRPPAPGLYRVVQAGEGARQEQLVVADGYHPLEADLAPRVVDLPAVDGEPPPAARGALVFWPWLAAGILLLSLVEWWVDARGR